MATKTDPTEQVKKDLESQIKAIEDEQQPTRDKIAELEGSLVEGQATIDRLTNAIRAIDGLPPLTRKKSAPSGSGERKVYAKVSDEDFERRVLEMAAEAGDAGIMQKAVVDDLNMNPNAVSDRFAQLVESGKLVTNGKERRARRWLAA